jgi:hypothetical protein
MVSGKFPRLPERGALGNGLRIAVGCVAVSDGVIDITTNNRRTLLRPYRNGRTEIVETSEQDSPTGTRIIVTFGPNLPRDECHDTTWAAHAVARKEGVPGHERVVFGGRWARCHRLV